VNAWRAATDFFGLRRNTALLLGALVLAGTGERLWLGFAPKYLETLGAGVAIIGLFDALQTLLGAAYAYPGGWATDRWGQRRALMFFNGLSLIGYLIVLLWKHWLALLLGSFLFLAWSALSLPTTFTVVATSLGAGQHTMGIGVQSMVRRIPMMIGPLAGGWLVTRFGWSDGVQYALLGCLLLGLCTAAFQSLMVDPTNSRGNSNGSFPLTPALSPGERENRRPALDQTDASGLANARNVGLPLPKGLGEGERSQQTPAPVPPLTFRDVLKSFPQPLRELLVSDILIRFCERLPYAWVIFWAMDHGGVSAQQFGLLVAIEMLTAMFCYIPVAHLADKYGRRQFVLATFVFFTLFPVTLLWARNFQWLVLAFAVRGLKEFGEPARKALIIGFCPAEVRGRMVGAYYLIRDSIVTLGSLIGAWLWAAAPAVNLWSATIFGAAGTVFYLKSFWRETVVPPAP